MSCRCPNFSTELPQPQPTFTSYIGIKEGRVVIHKFSAYYDGAAGPVTWLRTAPEQSHVTRHVLAGVRTLATSSGSVV